MHQFTADPPTDDEYPDDDPEDELEARRKKSAYNKVYDAAHREERTAHRKAYRAANSEKVSAYNKAYDAARREAKAAYMERYRNANRAALNAHARAYRAADIDAANARDKAYRDAHPERRRARYKLYDDTHQEKRATYRKAYRIANPERGILDSRNRRARKRGCIGKHTTAEWRAMCDWFGNVCLCCGAAAKLSTDHVVPVTKHGTNDICNLQPLCKSCNSKKKTKTTDYRDADRLAAFFRSIDVDRAARIHALDPHWQLSRDGTELLLIGNGPPAAWRTSAGCEAWIVAQEQRRAGTWRRIQ